MSIIFPTIVQSIPMKIKINNNKEALKKKKKIYYLQ